jgi:hypothetical protein
MGATTPDKAWRGLRVAHATLLASTLLLAAVAAAQTSGRLPQRSFGAGVVVGSAMGAAALLLLGLATALGRRLRAFEDSPGTVCRGAVAKRLHRYVGLHLLVWTLAKAIGVLGLTASLATRCALWFLPFGVATVATLWLRRPNRERFGRVATSAALP